MNRRAQREFDEHVEAWAAMTPAQQRMMARVEVGHLLTEMVRDFERCIKTFFDYEHWWYGTPNLYEGREHSYEENRAAVDLIWRLNVANDLQREYYRLQDISRRLAAINAFLEHGPLLFENLDIQALGAIERSCDETEELLEELREWLDEIVREMA